MAITRLQQARQMFRYGGDTMGGPNDKSANTGGGGGNTPNPHTDSGFSKASTSSKSTRSYDGPGNIHSDNPNAPEAYEIIGGTRFDVTPETRKERELAKVKAQIMKAPISNITPKGIEYFKDGIQIGFAPEPKQFGILDLALIAASGGLLGPKIATGAKMFNTAKSIANFANTIGLTDKNVIESFTDNFFNKGNTSTKKNNDIFNVSGGGGGDDRDGLASLENVDALNQEYLLLLKKFNEGVFTDEDETRFTFLQKMLGK